MRKLYLAPILLAAAVAVGISNKVPPPSSGDRSPADLMPERAFAYFELTGLDSVIQDIKASRLMELVNESEQFKAFMASDKGQKFTGGVTMAELMLGMDLWEAGGKIFGGDVAAALYPQAGSDQPAVILFVRPEDPASLEKPEQILGAFFEKVGEREGAAIFQPKGKKNADVMVALGDGWIAVSSQKEILEGCLALVAGKSDTAPLSAAANYSKMGEEMGTGHLGRVFVNTEMISEFTGGRMGIPEKLGQPLASLMFGGLLELAVHSPYAGMALDYKDGEVVLTAAVSGSPSDLGDPYQSFFAGVEEGAPIPDTAGLVGGFNLHRDIAAWYAAREELIADKALPGFDKFESGIGNLLPGKDFGQDVLPLIGKNVRFVASGQSYAHLDGAKPGIQLPGFALVFDLAKPDAAADIFQLTFQSLMAITNFQAAQQGRTPSVVEADIYNGVKFSAARQLEKPEGDRLDIAYNFLPAAARVGDKYILSSSLELCKSLIDTLQAPDADRPTGHDAELDLEMGPIVELLAANRKHLVANGIKKGKSSAEAKAEIDALLAVLGLFDSVKMDTAQDGESYRLKLSAKLK